jgi:hypothetical protein
MERTKYTEGFELFFRSYPPRWSETRNLWVRADKQGAFAEWQRLKPEEMIAALKAIQTEKAGKYVPDARKWLHHKRWQDTIAPLKQFERPLPAEIAAMVDKLAAQYTPPKEKRKSVNQQARELLKK